MPLALHMKIITVTVFSINHPSWKLHFKPLTGLTGWKTVANYFAPGQLEFLLVMPVLYICVW